MLSRGDLFFEITMKMPHEVEIQKQLKQYTQVLSSQALKYVGESEHHRWRSPT